ncbi:MAG: serine/threonine-protein kinase, partial [Planctomycetia bacterium]
MDDRSRGLTTAASTPTPSTPSPSTINDSTPTALTPTASTPTVELLSRRAAAWGLADAAALMTAETAAAGDPIDFLRRLAARKALSPFQADALWIGDQSRLRLGGYELIEPIGRGGMAIVYKARHTRMDRLVGLKALSPELRRTFDGPRRFADEAKAAARMTHPNIAAAYDAGEDGGVPYLALEYIDGWDFDKYVGRVGRLAPAAAVDVIRQAADGLEYAHKAGVLHRDVKPHNLMLAAEGVVKILDLGIARVAAVDEKLAGRRGLTEAGTAIGTAGYMAPEQAFDTRNVDHRADVYALGATLYFLLVGRPPYLGDSAYETMLAHREQPIPDLAADRPDAPPELVELFRSMMAKKPEDRPATAAEVSRRLSAIGGSRESLFLPPKPPLAADGWQVVRPEDWTPPDATERVPAFDDDAATRYGAPPALNPAGDWNDATQLKVLEPAGGEPVGRGGRFLTVAALMLAATAGAGLFFALEPFLTRNGKPAAITSFRLAGQFRDRDRWTLTYQYTGPTTLADVRAVATTDFVDGRSTTQIREWEEWKPGEVKEVSVAVGDALVASYRLQGKADRDGRSVDCLASFSAGEWVSAAPPAGAPPTGSPTTISSYPPTGFPPPGAAQTIPAGALAPAGV